LLLSLLVGFVSSAHAILENPCGAHPRILPLGCKAETPVSYEMFPDNQLHAVQIVTPYEAQAMINDGTIKSACDFAVNFNVCPPQPGQGPAYRVR
jgi:hypothetical protein